MSSNVVIVRGEYDNGFLPASKQSRTRESIPINTVVKQGDFKFGCCSGYTVVPKNDPLSLLSLARQLDVDIMLWGGTHNVEAFTLEGKFFVNPGSCTGAFNTDWPFTSEEEPKQGEDGENKPANAESKENEQEQKAEQVPEENLEQRPVEKPAHESTEQESGQQLEQESEQADREGFDQESKEVEQEPEGSEKKGENIEASENEKQETNEPVEDNLEVPELDIDGSNTPSFCLLDIQGSTCTLFIYIYVDGEVKVDKVVYQKEE